MKDEEMLFFIVLLVGGYWWFTKNRRSSANRLRGSRGSGSGAIGGSGSKAATTRQNSMASTNAQQGGGTGYAPAPIAQVGSVTGSGATPSGAGGASRVSRGIRSMSMKGLVSSFVSPSWPTTKVTSTGNIALSDGAVQVPSYTAVPLSIQGPGGGGSWLQQS